MVNPIEKKGWVATETIEEGEFIEVEPELFTLFEPATFYECSECGEQYKDKSDAQECCDEEILQ